MEKNSKSSGKYSVEEKNLLLLLTLKEKQVIESRTKSAATSKLKESIWEKIATEYNELTKGEPKDAKSLRLKYAMMKREIIKDTTNKRSEPPKTREKSKEKECDELMILDEDSSLTLNTSQRDFPIEVQVSTPQTPSFTSGEDLKHPPNETTTDSNLDCTPINKLPPQKIPIYDARALASEIDEIVRRVMMEDKETNTDPLDKESEIGIRTRPIGVRESVLDKHNRVCEKRLQLIRLQKTALRQFMRHKRDEHKLKVKHLEVEHNLRAKALGLNLQKKRLKSV